MSTSVDKGIQSNTVHAFSCDKPLGPPATSSATHRIRRSKPASEDRDLRQPSIPTCTIDNKRLHMQHSLLVAAHHAAASLSKPALRRMKGTTSIVGSFLARIILLPRIALGCQPVRKTYTEHLSRILIQSLRSLKQSSRTHAHNLHGS